MSFSKWIDIFTYRQKWENNIQFDKIKNYLEKLQDENDSEYFSKFIFYLLNYQKQFFYIKKEESQKQIEKMKENNSEFENFRQECIFDCPFGNISKDK